MQRYKLFYNKAILSIIRYEHNTQTETIPENCFVFSSVLDLKKIFSLFLNNNQSVTIVCKTDEEKNNLWNEIKNHFICQQAAGGIVFKENTVLSIYRFKHWDFPKGHLEKGETDIQAAIREVMEETDIDELSIYKDLGYTYHIFPSDNQFVLKETHWFEMQTSSNHTLFPQAEESIEKAEWIPVNQLNTIINNMYPSLVDLLERNGLIGI